MKALIRRLGLGLAALLVSTTAALAQPAFSPPQLEQLLAPIALYPDPLLSTVLVASTRPAEVAEAARWSRAHPGPAGDDAVRAAWPFPWDPSVKSLVAFPQVLAMMDQSPEWTAQLGSAFYSQQPQVMEAVQVLRQRAYAAGQLHSDARIVVSFEGPLILIHPAQPELVYVPVYDPRVVYVRPRRPVVGITFGPAVRVTTPVFAGRPDWPHRHVDVVRIERHAPPPRVIARERLVRVEPHRAERRVERVVVTRPAREWHGHRDERHDRQGNRHDNDRRGHGGHR